MALPHIVWAKTYPARTITMIAPAAAGGSTDVIARVVGEHMSRMLGQQIIIENVPGAGGAARTEAALTIGLLTERSSSSTANAVCDDDRPLANRIWIATTIAERPATTAAVSSATAK